MAATPRTPTPSWRPSGSLSRRRFLTATGGGLLAAGLVAACGSDDGDAGAPAEDLTAGEGALSALVAVFDVNAYAVAGSEQRLPVALLEGDGAFSSTGPDELTVSVILDGVEVDQVPVRRHDDQVPIGYYPVRYTFAERGLYQLRTEVDGTERTVDLAVNRPGEVGPVPIGDPMPLVSTATFDDPLGVDPICTRVPECPLHERSLTDELAAGQPTAVLISTPAYCQIGICGPVLDVMMGLTEDYPGVQFLHVEPFEDAEAVGGPAGATTTPIMTALQMTYEPALWVVGADGRVADRLDFVFDATEMRAALDTVA